MIDSLRLSVTQQCNLQCLYCHKEGQLQTKKEMTLQEIEDILKNAKETGIKKIKVTGGEPLIRNDIVDIIKIIKKHRFEDISLVTNGVLLASYARKLKEAGLQRINIGCDSLSSTVLLKNSTNFKEGLQIAQEVGLHPIKLNMVVLKGINDTEIYDMITFARNNNAILQLIELIQLNVNKEFYQNHFFDLRTIEQELAQKAVKIIPKEMQNRMQYDCGDVIVEVVRPFSKKFCKNCRRIRITSDGKIKPCLMKNDNLVPFKDKSSFIEVIEKKEDNYVQTS